MQQLQEEITSQLIAIKQEIDFKIPEFLKNALINLKVEQLSTSKKNDIIKLLSGIKQSNDKEFMQKLPECLLRHLLRIKKNTVQAVAGLNPQKPMYLGQLLTLTMFVYEDPILDQFGVLRDVTLQVNQDIQSYFEQHKDQLKLIKAKETELLVLMKQQINKPAIAVDQRNFTNCFCQTSQSIFQNNRASFQATVIQYCKMCQCSYHSTCLQLANVEIAQYVCPYCTITNVDPLHPVVQLLYKPQLLQFTQLNNQKTILFEVTERLKNHMIEARCLRMDGKGGLDEITWPDYGEVQVNGNKVAELLPLQMNYSLKKRRDQSIQIPGGLKIGEVNRLIMSEHKPSDEIKKSHRISSGCSYMLMICAVAQLSGDQLLQQIRSNQQNYLSREKAHQLIIQSGSQGRDPQLYYTNKISVMCQITMQLMQLPARGSLCQHAQCFDLHNYISMVAKLSDGKKWRCVVCKLKCYNFIIDQYQLSIVTAIRKHNLTIEEVQFTPDGEILDTSLRLQMQQQNHEDIDTLSAPKKIVKLNIN